MFFAELGLTAIQNMVRPATSRIHTANNSFHAGHLRSAPPDDLDWSRDQIMNDRTMKIIKRLLGTLGAAALIGCGAALAAPAAHADPYGSRRGGSPRARGAW